MRRLVLFLPAPNWTRRFSLLHSRRSLQRTMSKLANGRTPSIELVQAPTLFDLIDPSSLYISAPMDEVDTSRLSTGQPVRVTIDSHPGKSLRGRVARIAPYVLDLEQQNRTIEVEVELDDQEFSRTLLPGTSADVEVIMDGT